MLQAEKLGFDSWKGPKILLFAITSRLVLGPIQPAIQWVQPDGETDHSPSFIAEVKNTWSFIPISKCISWYRS